MGYPTTSDHLTNLPPEQMIPIFTKMVHSRFRHHVMIDNYWPSESVLGTNTIEDRFIGTTTIQAVVPGVRPSAFPTPTEVKTLVVDRTLLVRSNVDLLGSKQVDFNIMAELADDQAKNHALEYDRVGLHRLQRGAQQPALVGLEDAIKSGLSVELGANEDSDPDAFAEAILAVIRGFRKYEINREELMCIVWPDEYDTLLHNDKLVDRDFSQSGSDFSKGRVFTIGGIPIIESTAMPRELSSVYWADEPGKPQYGGHHPLSHAGNSYMYDVTADDVLCRAIICSRRSLLKGKTIDFTSKMWYNNEELQYFIDTYGAYAMDWRRQDCCGAVYAEGVTFTPSLP